MLMSYSDKLSLQSCLSGSCDKPLLPPRHRLHRHRNHGARYVDPEEEREQPMDPPVEDRPRPRWRGLLAQVCLSISALRICCTQSQSSPWLPLRWIIHRCHARVFSQAHRKRSGITQVRHEGSAPGRGPVSCKARHHNRWQDCLQKGRQNTPVDAQQR